MPLEEIHPTPKSPKEQFQDGSQILNFTVGDFWQWNQSDLIENRNRGILAEFIVKKALNIKSETRIEWDNYDFATDDNIKIEVKSAAYIQAWKQTKPSRISFDISPKQAILPDGNLSTDYKRWADIYIFCLLHHQDQATINPMDLSQWTFYLVTAAALDQHYPGQKTIGLWGIERITHQKCTYSELKEGFEIVRLHART